MKTYAFVEPHVTSGYATIEITEKQILKYMKIKTNKIHKYRNATDKQLIHEFIVVNWCKEYNKE